jgi:hypothetical protein
VSRGTWDERLAGVLPVLDAEDRRDAANWATCVLGEVWPRYERRPYSDAPADPLLRVLARYFSDAVARGDATWARVNALLLRRRVSELLLSGGASSCPNCLEEVDPLTCTCGRGVEDHARPESLAGCCSFRPVGCTCPRPGETAHA